MSKITSMPKRKRPHITRKRFIPELLHEQSKDTLVQLAIELGKKLETSNRLIENQRVLIGKMKMLRR